MFRSFVFRAFSSSVSGSTFASCSSGFAPGSFDFSWIGGRTAAWGFASGLLGANTGLGLCGLFGPSVLSTGLSELADSISSLSDFGPELLGRVGGRPLLKDGLGRFVRTEMVRAVVATSSSSVSVFCGRGGACPLVLDLPEDSGLGGREGLFGLDGRPNPCGLLGRPDP